MHRLTREDVKRELAEVARVVRGTAEDVDSVERLLTFQPTGGLVNDFRRFCEMDNRQDILANWDLVLKRLSSLEYIKGLRDYRRGKSTPGHPDYMKVQPGESYYELKHFSFHVHNAIRADVLTAIIDAYTRRNSSNAPK
jgi:hypothetical protein